MVKPHVETKPTNTATSKAGSRFLKTMYVLGAASALTFVPFFKGAMPATEYAKYRPQIDAALARGAENNMQLIGVVRPQADFYKLHPSQRAFPGGLFFADAQISNTAIQRARDKINSELKQADFGHLRAEEPARFKVNITGAEGTLAGYFVPLRGGEKVNLWQYLHQTRAKRDFPKNLKFEGNMGIELEIRPKEIPKNPTIETPHRPQATRKNRQPFGIRRVQHRAPRTRLRA